MPDMGQTLGLSGFLLLVFWFGGLAAETPLTPAGALIAAVSVTVVFNLMLDGYRRLRPG